MKNRIIKTALSESSKQEASALQTILQVVDKEMYGPTELTINYINELAVQQATMLYKYVKQHYNNDRTELSQFEARLFDVYQMISNNRIEQLEIESMSMDEILTLDLGDQEFLETHLIPLLIKCEIAPEHIMLRISQSHNLELIECYVNEFLVSLDDQINPPLEFES
jgi:hypothetical protein